MKKILLSAGCGILALTLSSQTITRPKDPVILKGSQLTQYANESPSNLVAFKYQGGNWIQIPLQIDEKELKDIVSGYGPLANGSQFPPSASNPKILFYSDANTHIGADSNPLFDADDELVFMINDVGEEFTGTTLPAGVINGSCTQVYVADLLPGGGTWYVYLFKQDGSLQQSAGTNYVTFSSNVSSVSGWPAHLNGLNTENTTASTSNYSWHISGEWISDELKLALGTNVDVLDRHKNFFANSTCVRTENTFSDAENAYLVSKVGPIRAIRSVMGANSGPLTQRTHIFYKERIDISTDLRVHSIPSVYDAFDYSPAANGMEYRNNNNYNSAVIIDGTGTTDGLSLSNALEWEHLTGSQGSISIVHKSETTILPADNVNIVSYYDDNSASPASSCTGDGQAWGTSGWGTVFNSSITTDPVGDAGANNLRNLRATRIVYPAAANQPHDDAVFHYSHNVTYPIFVSTASCTSGSNLIASITATEILCEGDSSIITVNTSNANGTITYAWAHNTTITNNVAIVTAGTYLVIVSDDVDSVTLSITVDEPEEIDLGITFPNNISAIANADNVQYNWISCTTGEAVIGATGKTFISAIYDIYALAITTTDGCTDTSECFPLGSVSIHENPLAEHISLFPNPSSDIMILNADFENMTLLNYQITDITGRIISTKNITENQTVIDVQHLANSLYIIKITQDNKDIKHIRFIKN